MLRKFAAALAFLLIAVTASSSLSAAPITSCGAGAACDGNLYAVWVVSQTATSYVLEVDVQVTTAYTGSMGDYLNALAITPDNNSSFTSASLLAHPAGIWAFKSGGLNAGGCDGSGTVSICAQAFGLGAKLFSGGTPQLLSFQFLINGAPPVAGDTAHLKYLYVNSSGSKVGNLGSFDVAIQCIGANNCDGGGGQSTPEPVSFVLAGTGLIGIYFIRRRRSSSTRS